MILDVFAVFIYDYFYQGIQLLFLMLLSANYSFFLIFNACLSLAENSETTEIQEPHKPWRIVIHLGYFGMILWTIFYPHDSVGCSGTRVYPLSFGILGCLFIL